MSGVDWRLVIEGAATFFVLLAAVAAWRSAVASARIARRAEQDRRVAALHNLHEALWDFEYATSVLRLSNPEIRRFQGALATAPGPLPKSEGLRGLLNANPPVAPVDLHAAATAAVEEVEEALARYRD